MKKTLTILLTLIITISSVICVPIDAFAATYKPDKKIYAEAYMLINLDDDALPVVAEKNPDKRLYPASLTKIVTAMVTLKNVKDVNTKIKMSQRAYDSLIGTGAQTAGIVVGEELTVDMLLYLTMVHSACDACQMLAEYVGGSCEKFVAMMNDYATSLGCKDTNFVNPDGLHDKNHYTTARDMSIITIDALKNPEFVKYATATQIEYNGYTLAHTNLMLQPGYITYYYEYAQGIKTGSTEEAEYCVITKASKDGYNYLAIVMKSPQKKIKNQSYLTKCSFVDAKSLFEWAFDSLKYTTLIKSQEVIGEVGVEDGKDADSVQLVAGEDLNVIVPVALDKSAVIIDPIEKPESITAPVRKGDYVCKANIIYADEVIATIDLVAGRDVELSTFLKVINWLKAFFGSTVVKLVIVLIVLFVIIYILIFYRNIKKKKNSKHKRSRSHDDDYDNRRNSGRRGGKSSSRNTSDRRDIDDLEPPTRWR